MTATLSSSTTPQTRTLLRIYLARFAFAAAWAAILISTSPTVGPLLTVLLVLYPLVAPRRSCGNCRPRVAKLPRASPR